MKHLLILALLLVLRISSSADEKPFANPEEILATILPNHQPTGREWNPVAVQLACDDLKQLVGRQASFSIRVASILGPPTTPGHIQLEAQHQTANLHGSPFVAITVCRFPLSAAESLAKIKQGDSLRVQGVISESHVSSARASHIFSATIKDCTFTATANGLNLGGLSTGGLSAPEPVKKKRVGR
jgi:hypothetical protein